MSRIALVGGSYYARSPIASAIRCVNYFPEKNPESSSTPMTYYQRPGKTPLVTAPGGGAVRGIYRTSNGLGYCVIGQNVYAISSSWQLTLLGQLNNFGTNPVSFIDNGIQIMLVDNSNAGYLITLPTTSSNIAGTANAFSQIVDTTGLFQGATRLDYLDSFVLWNTPGTNLFNSTLSNQILPMSALYFAGKTSYPDPLQTLIVNRREIYLIGQLKSEVWYNAGNPLFPFAELPGAYIEQGTCAPYSIVSQGEMVFFLTQNLSGEGMIWAIQGYSGQRISNHAIEYALRQIVAQGGTINDCIGMAYQQDGHQFVEFTFPDADQTWVYDLTIGNPEYAWHQRGWTDNDGILHREREMCIANLYGKIVCGDWSNGTIYAMDLNAYTDTLVVGGIPGPIQYVKTFHLIDHATPLGGELPLAQLVDAEGRQIQFHEFLADMEVGEGPLDVNGGPAQVGLRWSDDRGKTFGNTVLQTNGIPGQYLTQPSWSNLGTAKYRIFELFHSIAGPAALNGAWTKARVLAK